MLNANKNTFSCMTVKKTAQDLPGANAVSYAGLRLCFLLSGDARWQINDRTYAIRPGDIFFLSDRQKRRFAAHGENGFSLAAFTLDRQLFANTSHFSFFLTCIQEKNGVLHSPALYEILCEIYNESKGSAASNYELISAKLTEFFIKAERSFGFDAASAVKIDKNMIRILDYIDTHITEKISLAAVSEMAGFTESSFSRWFSRLNGISFKKYVMSKIIEYAVKLLETTDLKVVEIAFECGFDFISGFYDTFRKVTGTTPNKFTYII